MSRFVGIIACAFLLLVLILELLGMITWTLWLFAIVAVVGCIFTSVVIYDAYKHPEDYDDPDRR